LVKLFHRGLDFGILSFDFIKSNHKSIVITGVGLVLALAVIAENDILISSQRSLLFQKYVLDDLDLLLGDVGLHSNLNFSEYSSFSENNYFTIHQTIEQTIAVTNYDQYYVDQLWLCWTAATIWHTESRNDVESLSLIIPPFDFFSEIEPFLIEGSRVPSNSSEILVVHMEKQPTHRPFLHPGNITKLSFQPSNFPSNESLITLPVNITGVLTLGDVDWWRSKNIEAANTQSQLVWKHLLYDTQWGRRMIIISPEFVTDLFSQLEYDSLFKPLQMKVHGKIFLDHSVFDPFHVEADKTKLEVLLETLEFDFHQKQLDIEITTELLDRMDDFSWIVIAHNLLFFLNSIPVIGIALYLVFYSYGLTRRELRKNIGIIKTRGGSTLQIFSLLFIMTVYSTVLAAMIGFLVGYLFSNLILRSTDFLEFAGQEIMISLQPNVWGNLPIFTVFFAILVNSSNIIRSSKMKIIDTIKPLEVRPPLWKRLYIDVIFVVLGLAGFYIIFLWTQVMNVNEEAWTPAIDVAFWFLGLPSPILLFFGSILLISRLFPIFLRFIATITWKNPGGMTGYTFNNLLRHKHMANRAIVLVTLTLSFSIIMSSLFESTKATKQMEFYYTHGADMKVSVGQVLNYSTQALLDDMNGIKSISGIIRTESTSQSSDRPYIEFLFIDPQTYIETAFFDEARFGLSSSFEDLVSKIADNRSILMFKPNFESHPSLSIGTNFTFQFNQPFSLPVMGTFEFWPQIIPGRAWRPLIHTFSVGSLGLFEYLNRTVNLGYKYAEYLLKLNNPNDAQSMRETIETQTGLTVHSAILDYEEYISSIDWQFNLITYNSNFLICIAITIIVMIMFAFHSYLDRLKELGIERAMGMTRLQCGMSFLTEGLTILAFGIIIGLVTGLFYASLYLFVTFVGIAIPPMVIAYPWDFFVRMIFVILLFCVGGMLFPSYLVSRKDIAKILKYE
jgi:ABC-type antimicrobial peptide transport system permease subunit